jgi:6-methylsalicylate decarboxylase
MPLIDVHHHPTLRRLISHQERQGVPVFRGAPPWDPDIAIERMSVTGTDMSILSLPAELSWAGNDRESITADINDELVEIIRRSPARFGAFATLPMPDIGTSVSVALAALQSGWFEGVTLLTSYQGSYLNEPAYVPLLEALNDQSAVVFLHPILLREAPAGLSPALLEGTFDTTRAITAMAEADIFSRFPSIRYIVPHAGGMVPYSKWRIALNAIQHGDWTIEPTEEQIEAEVRKLDGLYYDTTLNLGSLLAMERTDRILFGTDVPWAPTSVLRMERDYALQVREGWTATQAQAVASGNALRLLPHAASRLFKEQATRNEG